jgi:hypothetical protein
MYEVRYYCDYDDRYVVIATCETIESAGRARQVSGDLVVDAATNVVASDSSWLWDWERDDTTSYARHHLGRHRPGQRISS